MRLSDAPIGVELRLGASRLDDGATLRLSELGLRSGTVIRVLQRAGFDGRLIAVGSARLALDGRTAGGIDVEHASST